MVLKYKAGDKFILLVVRMASFTIPNSILKELANSCPTEILSIPQAGNESGIGSAILHPHNIKTIKLIITMNLTFLFIFLILESAPLRGHPPYLQVLMIASSLIPYRDHVRKYKLSVRSQGTAIAP